ncbi:MAG: hypothetical protein JOY87_06300 [Candidatus Eremiobacteraeota bacterium]|nr:hypothetical protein [Candidatus Eremiobacteraeota bacterium]
MNQKRQIIKTRPQRPYIIARIIIALMCAVVIAVTAWWSYHQTVRDRVHANAPASLFQAVPSPWEEAHAAGRMPPIRPTWEQVCA